MSADGKRVGLTVQRHLGFDGLGGIGFWKWFEGLMFVAR